jgi:hypothetical protein
MVKKILLFPPLIALALAAALRPVPRRASMGRSSRP